MPEMTRKKKYALNGIPLILAIALTIPSGCRRIPSRDRTAVSTILSRRSTYGITEKPIRSEYMDLAEELQHAPATTNSPHYLSLLDIGDDAYLARIHLIRAARKNIDIQTFIWFDDSSSRLIFDELLHAAKRGVKIRILIDGLKYIGPPEMIARMAMAHRNIDICIYRPLSPDASVSPIDYVESLLLRMRKLNLRMHNKLVIVDNKVAIIGGRNFKEEYYDRSKIFNYKDRDVVVIGPSIAEMNISFEQFWQNDHSVFLTQFRDLKKHLNEVSTGTPLSTPGHIKKEAETLRLASEYSLASKRSSMSIDKVKHVVFVSDTPQKLSRRRIRAMDNASAKLIPKAQESLIIQTPYLIYDRKERRAFNRLREKNPKLRIIASTNGLASGDHVHAFALSFKHRKHLFKSMHIDIYEFKPHPLDIHKFVPRYPSLIASILYSNGINGDYTDTTAESLVPITCSLPRLSIHAKSMVIDDSVALIGSHNFDPRSRNLNSECGIIIFDRTFAKKTADAIRKDIEPQNSWTVAKAREKDNIITYLIGFLGAISTAIPFFDFWPYTYTSVFEILPGKETLPPRHPDFYENYYNVGQFPEVRGTTKAIRTLIFKTFGGWSRSLM